MTPNPKSQADSAMRGLNGEPDGAALHSGCGTSVGAGVRYVRL